MIHFKKTAQIAVLCACLSFAFVAEAQSSFSSNDEQSFLVQLFGGQNPTSTEDVLEMLLKQQAEQRVSGSFITLAPEFPGPKEEALVRLTSHSFDVDASSITWIRNGRVALSGRGEKTLRFITGDVGARESIELVAITPLGDEFKTSKIFYIGDIDLLWRAQTVVPPEYAGKALASPRSLVMVAAVPNFILGGRSLSAASLVYDWTLDDKPQTSKSGYGKRTYSFYASVATGAVHEVKVKIYNTDKSVLREKSIFITSRDPQVLIYEEDPAGGPKMGRAIKSFEMYAGEERAFRVLPYFFSSVGNGDLQYEWQVDGKKAEDAQKPDVLRVRLTNDAVGITNVNVLVQSAKNFIQRAQAYFAINIL